MFETLELLSLQQYWWFIVSLLAAILIFLMFVQGGQTLIYTIGKTEKERSFIVNALGRKWELTFTTLVTFGGAFFASFPLFYATSFGGAYWVWMLILFAFVIQAVSYEYRTKPDNFLGQRVFEIFLFINGALGTILLGTAVSTMFTGSEFSINEMNFSTWKGSLRGLEAVLCIQNVFLGLAVFFLARVLGAMYFMNHIRNNEVFARAKKQVMVNAVPFLVFFLAWLIWLLLRDGFAVNPTTKEVFMERYKYLHNFIAMPLVLVLLLVGVIGVLFGIYRVVVNAEKHGRSSFWFSGLGTVFTVLALLLALGYNNTAFYPSTYDLQSSLTIENASSSHYTLTAMSYVSLLVPFVIAYIVYVWRAINSKPMDDKELNQGNHIY